MNKLIKFAVGSALAVSATSAFAVTSPTTTTGGSLTLQLFSTNDGTPFSYSFDTGLTYSTLSSLPTAPGSSTSFSLTGLATDLTGFTGTSNLVFDVVASQNKGGSTTKTAGIYNLATTFDPGVTSAQITTLNTNSAIQAAMTADTTWLVTDFGATNPSFTTSTTAANYANANFNASLNTFGVNAASATGNSLPFYELSSAIGAAGAAGQTPVVLAGVWTINLSTDTLTYSVPNSSPVPVPAALWLLVSGLAGLGVVGRRRNQPA